MILGKTEEQQAAILNKKLSNKLPLMKPHKWFAWYPVYIGDNQSAWLCYVWRMKLISTYSLSESWYHQITEEEAQEYYDKDNKPDYEKLKMRLKNETNSA